MVGRNRDRIHLSPECLGMEFDLAQLIASLRMNLGLHYFGPQTRTSSALGTGLPFTESNLECVD
jgi:hypothetical protein